MNKVSLIAASVAFALTGCGGSDGGSNDGPSGVTITGFDGYFYNAVVFEDSNNNGQWDTQEAVLGLTDVNGQVTLAKKPSNPLALQTITPNGAKQQQLIALDDKYAGTYTVDMDHKGQAMAHELVFRAPTSSNVISPITDLVVIEMANNTSLTEEEAKANVNLALGGTDDAPIDLYSDFVEGTAKNAALHKTAQILTESKAQNPSSYVNKAADFAQVANDIVNSMTEEEITDVNNKPVIEDSAPESDELSPVTVNNTKLTISASVKTAAEEALNNLEIVKGTVFGGVTINVEGLFQDKDQNLVTPELTENLADAGIQVNLVSNQLTLSSAEALKAGTFAITLTAQDLNSSGKEMSDVSVVFTIKIESANQAPLVVETEQTRLQAIVDGWQLQQGEAFEQTLDISGLFTDGDGEVVDYNTQYVAVEGLSISENDNAIITIKGTPVNAYEAGQAFTVSAEDNEGMHVQLPFFLPEVKEGVTPPSETHPLEGQVWYRLEHGSSTESEEFNYSRIWCDTLSFDNGVVNGNTRTLSNLTECGEVTGVLYNGSYEVQGDKIIASFSGDEGVELAELTIKDADEISEGAKTLYWTYPESGETEIYTLFSVKADAEARIQIKSDDAADNRMFPMTLPTAIEGQYATGKASVSLLEKANVDDSGAMDANLLLEFDNQDLNCADVSEFYRSMTFTGEGLEDGIASVNPSTGGFECYNKVENNITYAAIDFDLPQLTKGNIYSFVGKVQDSQGEFIEAIKFNITWTGTGNNE